MRKLLRTWIILSSLLILTSCSRSSEIKGTTGRLEVDCSGMNCGAYNQNTFSGRGVGVWKFANTGKTSVQVPVEINRVAGRTAILVFTNPTAEDKNAPVITLSPEQANPLVPVSQPSRSSRHSHPPKDFSALKQKLKYKNHLAPYSPRINHAVNDTKAWWLGYAVAKRNVDTTLIRQETAFDGRKINFWVEDSEYDADKISDDMLETFAERFVNGSYPLYNSVTSIAGQPWGPHEYSALIGENQDLNIVFYSFVPDGQRASVAKGYYDGVDTFLQSEYSDSNESLALYIDSEEIYLQRNPDDSQNELAVSEAIYTLVHEMVHMSNWYRRSVTDTSGSDYSFDQWAEEMTAMMMEDLLVDDVDTRLFPMGSRFSDWITAGGYNCDFRVWDLDNQSPCYTYSINGTFGAYLLRHLGLRFYSQLLLNKSSEDSLSNLDTVIKAAGVKEGFPEIWRKFSTTGALLPYNQSPAFYGVPWTMDNGWSLYGIDSYAYLNYQVLPSTVPNKIVPYGSFLVVRTALPSTYTETVDVPPGVVLTVLIRRY